MNTEQHSGVVYLITAPDGRRYVGRATDYDKRMNDYRLWDRHGGIGPSIDEYGWENHDRRPLMRGVDPAVLVKTETAFIEMLKPELNCMWARGGRVYHTEATKQQMSKDRVGRKRTRESVERGAAKLRGIPRPQEVRDKISAKKKGTKLSSEHCAQISLAMVGENNPFYGKKHTPETCAKISAHNKGRKRSQEAIDSSAAKNRGRKRTSETREKMSAARRGKKYGPLSPEHRANVSDAVREAHRIKRIHNRIKELCGLGWHAENMLLSPV